MNSTTDMPSASVPALQLDPAAVGNLLIRAVLSSALAGHAAVGNTVRDYVDRNKLDSPEARFVYDVLYLGGSTPEIAERWFGGLDNAAAIAAEEITSLLAEMER